MNIIIVLFLKFIFFLFNSYFKFIFVTFFFIYFLICHFTFFLCFKGVHHVIIFSFIPTDLLKILREERQDHSNYRQNSRLIAFAVILLQGLELDNFALYFSPPHHPYLAFAGHPSPSILRSAINTVKFQCTFHLKRSGTSGLHSHQQEIDAIAVSHLSTLLYSWRGLMTLSHQIGTYMFLEKKQTSKFTERFKRIKVELPIFCF